MFISVFIIIADCFTLPITWHRNGKHVHWRNITINIVIRLQHSENVVPMVMSLMLSELKGLRILDLATFPNTHLNVNSSTHVSGPFHHFRSHSSAFERCWHTCLRPYPQIKVLKQMWKIYNYVIKSLGMFRTLFCWHVPCITVPFHSFFLYWQILSKAHSSTVPSWMVSDFPLFILE